VPGVVAGASTEPLTQQPLRVFTRSGTLHVVSVDPGTSLIRAEVEQRVPDREYRITLRRAGEWQPGEVRTNIRIRTDDAAFPEVAIPFEALVLTPPK
jgi:hypothetical protein